jgi:hypothetical protein
MQTIADSKLAPGGNIDNMIQPSKMIDAFGNINTSIELPTKDNSILASVDNYSPIEDNDKIGLVDYQNNAFGGFTYGQLTQFPEGFTRGMTNINDSQLVTEDGASISPNNMINMFGNPGTISSFALRFQEMKYPSDSSWKDLYNADHTSDTDHRLNIRYGSSMWPQEPYIVTDIGSREAGGRIFVGDRGSKDALRIASWYASPRSGAWFLTQNLFQWMNPRGHRLVSEVSILGSSIPILGTNVKLRLSRGYDFEGGTFLGLSIPATGGEYPWTLSEINSDEAVGRYGNKYQIEKGDGKLKVAPIPFDQTLLPLPIRDESIKLQYQTYETRLGKTDGVDGWGMLGRIPFLSRRLTYRPTGQNSYSTDHGLLPNTLFTLPVQDSSKEGVAVPKYAVTLENTKKRFKHLAEDQIIEVDYHFGNFHNIRSHPIMGVDSDATAPYNFFIPGANVNKSIDPRVETRTGLFGDFMTLTPPVGKTLKPNAKTLSDAYGDFAEDIESEKNGMPVYFKDLRDNTYIIFRGFINGITENVSPSWAETNYIGRSESVYVYERASRDISFTLKLFANTIDELDVIYKKLNRLTSLCYPKYKEDVKLGSKIRMKPPLTRFRLGELYGSTDSEVGGFIKSLSYTIPDESPWETKKGKRVPKLIEAAISYQVIHNSVPSISFVTPIDGIQPKETFYGILGKDKVSVTGTMEA